MSWPCCSQVGGTQGPALGRGPHFPLAKDAEPPISQGTPNSSQPMASPVNVM